MPRRSKMDLAKLHASMDTTCPHCGFTISPAELVRIDSERVRCPSCRKDLVRKKKNK